MEYDVTIKAHPKDYYKLDFVLDSLIFLHPQPENVYIISPDGFVPDNKKYFDKIVAVKDSQIIPNINKNNLNYRKNWTWQNIVSILQDVTKNDLYLDIQADNFFINDIELFDINGKPNIFRSTQNSINNDGHPPYFNFNKNVFNLERKWNGYSYIIEFMLYDKKILKDFFNKNFESSDKLLNKIYENINESSYLGDQEFYGNLIDNHYKNHYNFINNFPIVLDGSHKDVSIDFIKQYSINIKNTNPEIVAFSYHTWRITE